MKIAVSGKGGVGKSTVAAAIALIMSASGRRVLALDADPDGSLASALGFTADARQQVIPISRRIALIEERTGANVNRYGQVFKLNPAVADIADSCAVTHNGVSLLVLGAIERGGSGCACPESVFIKTLVADLVLRRNEALVMDMEAGIEHLGRATARGVDVMLVVVEPTMRSAESALRIIELAGQIGIGTIRLVGNKIASPADERFLISQFPGDQFAGFIPFCAGLALADREARSVIDGADRRMIEAVKTIIALAGERDGTGRQKG